MEPADRVPLSETLALLGNARVLPFDVFEGAGRLLLAQGSTLPTARQFEILVERGAWISRGALEPLLVGHRQASSPAAAPATLFGAWDRAFMDFDALARRFERGEARGEELLAFHARLRRLVAADGDVALFMCMRRETRSIPVYAVTHAVHAAVLVTLAGTVMCWPGERVDMIGRAALSMNFGMVELQAVLAEQEDPPTARQLEQIRQHPQVSARLLREAGIDDAAWLATVEAHHEDAAGGGYPLGLESVPESAQLLRLADVFMAKLSPRARRVPMAPQAATRQLFQQHGMTPLVGAIIKAVGVSPPGSLVQLESGEIGVVTRRTGKGAAPVVATLSDARGRPATATQHRDASEPAFALKGSAPEATLFPRVLPERVYGLMPAP